MNDDYILLAGIKNPDRLCDYFASHVVDDAYAEKLGDDRVRISVEPRLSLREEDSVNWVLDLVIDALRKSEEDEFTTQIMLVEKRA